MEWPSAFYEWKSGKGCPACEQGRPNETDDGVRFFAGEVVDAYLRRTDIQRGLSVAIWRGRHVVEPTELSEEETTSYWRELRLVAAAIEEVMRPVKMNYNLLGNSVPHLHTHVVPRYADDCRAQKPRIGPVSRSFFELLDLLRLGGHDGGSRRSTYKTPVS